MCKTITWHMVKNGLGEKCGLLLLVITWKNDGESEFTVEISSTSQYTKVLWATMSAIQAAKFLSGTRLTVSYFIEF